MEVLYLDNKIIVCVKPAGVLSTDEPGGMPSLLRAALGDDTAPVYTVHRLDAAVSGVMVYARTRHAAADLGRAIERGDVRKEYLAVACGALPEQRGDIEPKKQMAIVYLASLVVGAYDGFYGPGTGTFLLLIFCNLGKLDVRTAGGNVKLVNLSSNIASLLTSLLSGKVFLVLGLIGTVSSILGHFIGAGLAIKNGSKIVKPAIILVLVLLAAKVVQGLIAG